MTVEGFKLRLDENLKKLSEDLRSGNYQPQQIRRHYIPKPGSKETRPLGIPTVRDRVVQTAVLMVMEPIFEHDFAEHSYGFRPGRGCKDALRRVDQLLKEGYTYIVDADLKSYFDTIPHDRLMALVGQKVSDGRVLSLIESFLKQGVLDGLREWTPEEGSPQGGCISPLLSNIYLNPLDHLMAQRGFRDGALRRRFRDHVSQSRGCRSCLGPGARMDGGSRPETASGEDQDRRCEDRTPLIFWAIGSSEGAYASRDPRACRNSKTRSERRRSEHRGRA